MSYYFNPNFTKLRQQQILEDFKRIKISQSPIDPEKQFFRRIVVKIRSMLSRIKAIFQAIRPMQ